VKIARALAIAARISSDAAAAQSDSIGAISASEQYAFYEYQKRARRRLCTPFQRGQE
jgi:hypothetical protein